jgi:fatty-acyl-CoA synthase
MTKENFVQGAPHLMDLLRHNTLYFPHKVALRLDGREITNIQLLGTVNSIHKQLGGDVQPGQRVALWFQNSLNWLASFIAINALGAVSVPINTRLTACELEIILKDVQPMALITTKSYRGRAYDQEARDVLSRLPWSTLMLDASLEGTLSDWPLERLGAGSLNLDTPSIPDLMCIQYTSGTTSLPKGAMLLNRSYVKTAYHVASCQGLNPHSEFISAAPFFHCSGTMHAITVCLVSGATLNAMSAWDPEVFLALVEKHHCDVSHMVYFRDVLALKSSQSRRQLQSMKVTHDLGTPEFLQRIHDELGIAGVSNIYGMTETCGQFAMWHAADDLEKRLSSNGRPQVGNEFRIVDAKTLKVMGPHELGEIQMRGHTITPGYFNHEAATVQAFTKDGWFHSGDLGTLNELGELTYIARLKDIIRVGGENLAPVEVEQVLRDCSGLSQVCVLALPDERLDEVVSAVIVGADPHQDWSEVVGKMRQRLAGFKVPKSIYLTDALPITATNRVQKDVLRSQIQKNLLHRVV